MSNDDPNMGISRATAEGQTVHLAGGLRNAGRTGKVIAYVWLLGLVAVGIFFAVAVISSQ